MAAGHLITLAELSLGGDEDLDGLLDSRRQLLVGLALLQALDVDDNTLCSVWNLERCVSDFLGLLTEDRVQKLELRSCVALALRSDLTYKDVARMYHGTDLDNTFLIQHLQHLLAGVRDVAGKLLGTELCLSDVGYELVDVDGCVDILLDDAL